MCIFLDIKHSHFILPLSRPVARAMLDARRALYSYRRYYLHVELGCAKSPYRKDQLVNVTGDTAFCITLLNLLIRSGDYWSEFLSTPIIN